MRLSTSSGFFSIIKEKVQFRVMGRNEGNHVAAVGVEQWSRTAQDECGAARVQYVRKGLADYSVRCWWAEAAEDECSAGDDRALYLAVEQDGAGEFVGHGCAWRDSAAIVVRTAMVFWRSDTSNLSTPAMTEPPRMSVPYSALVNLGNRCELIPYLARLQGSMSCIKTQSPIPKAKRTRRISHFLDSPAINAH